MKNLMIEKLKKSVRKLNKVNRIIFMTLCIALIVWMIILFSFEKKDVNNIRAAEQSFELASNIKKFYANRPGYWGLNSKSVIDNKLATPDMISQDKLINAIGKLILVGNGVDGQMVMPGARSFDVVYKNLDKVQCLELATYELDETQALSIINITIINKTQTKEFSWGGENKLPIGASVARTFCEENNDIIWHYE